MSSSSSEDSLGSVDEKFADQVSLGRPVVFSINMRARNAEGHWQATTLDPSQPRFKFIAAAVSNVLATFCSLAGHDALVNTAIMISKRADVAQSSEVMRQIASENTHSAAIDWVNKFRRDIFEKLPAIWIDEQIDKTTWAATSQVDVTDWSDKSVLDTVVIHISKALVDSMCLAAGQPDKRQYRNYMCLIHFLFSHEIGGHTHRMMLAGVEYRRAGTPENVGADISHNFQPLFPYWTQEAGTRFEDDLFGGHLVPLVEDPYDDIGGYYSFTPHLLWKSRTYDERMYVRRIPDQVIDRVLNQGTWLEWLT